MNTFAIEMKKAGRRKKKNQQQPFLKQRRNQVLIALIIVCILIAVFSRFPVLVEKYYALGIYPSISGSLRVFFGHLPFSLGDILYSLMAIFVLWRLFRFFKRLFKKLMTRNYLIKSAYTLLFIGTGIYLLFNLLWGLNYNRRGIASQLGLQPDTSYTGRALDTLAVDLMHKTNTYRKALGQPVSFPNQRTLFNEAEQAYQVVSQRYPFLVYRHKSIKVPVYNKLGSYLGYSGYYNPFTGEAQVNTVLPDILLPYVSCHEMAHQLGYATEDEANFVGFLSATSSSDPLFKYSTYLELFRYANSELWYRDSTLAKANYEALHPWVKEDMAQLRAYFKAHENPFERLTNIFYGWFLKANQQPQGLDTYDKVTAWLIAYRRKYGKL